ncbi:MAG TPA: diguanylate cyclase [Neobacillus sp.]
MNFNRYKNLLFQKIKKQISIWFESKDDLIITNSEVYQFLDTIKESSETLQLGGLQQLSGMLMDHIKEKDHKQWGKEELRIFLDELISLTYDYENFFEGNKQKEKPRGENIPLIQIIDDDVSMLILLKDALEEKGWMVIANTSPEKARSQYIDLRPDCVIISANLENKKGFQVLHDLQKYNSHQFVPKIIISIFNNRETRINAYKMGVDDFIEKPIDLEELTVRIDRNLQRKKLYDQSVLLDELTKLYNRKFLKDVYERNLNDLKRNKQIFSIAFLDIDHFKQINDTYGHLTGDEILYTFASFLKENSRSSDIVFRYGGEEFVILFQKTDQLEAVAIVTRFLKQFSELQFNKNDGYYSVSFSAGVYTINSQDTTIEAALKAADQALYKAKENGRARVETINQDSIEHSRKPLFVSIIDDNALIRTMLLKILKTMDLDYYDINLEAFEGGIQFFESNRLNNIGDHFLILDGVMPVMDGIEILQKVKNIKNGANIMVLMLTGRSNESDIERALKLGADDYVTKPFSITELQVRIQQLIQRLR